MVENKSLTDEEIVSRVLEGETSFYELIVRRYNPYLYKIGRSYNYNHQDTEDLMQDTFVDAYKSLDQFEGRSSFKTWIVRIMMNNCYRKNKKFSFKNEVVYDVKEDATPLFTDGFNEADKLIQDMELRHIIESALERVPLEYRMVFSLREINQFNVAETAELLDISESNVKVRLNRAKAMLRKEIVKSYVPEELYSFNLIHCTPMVQRVMTEINKLQ